MNLGTAQQVQNAGRRRKQKFLGLRLAFTSVWDTFCIRKTMTCDNSDL